MKKSIRKIGIVIMAAVLLAFSVGSTGASAALGTVREAQQKKEQLQDNLKEAQKLIDKLKENKGDIEKTVTELDQKLTGISEQISDLESQVQKKEKEIKSTKKELKAARSDEKVQYESMKKRIRYMYEYSGMSYLEALLSANTFADFLNQVEYISQMMEYDRNMLSEYQKTRKLIENSEKILKEDKTELVGMKEKLEEEQKAVDLLLEEKENQLSRVNAGLSDAQSEAGQYEAEIAAENAVIQQILAAEERARQEEARRAEEAKKAQQAENSQKENGSDSETDSSKDSSKGDDSKGDSSGGSSNVNTDNSYTGGAFTWPCPSSHRITSKFGYRDSPTAGATRYHQGIDIGASYGAAIVAASDGVVTSTGYNSVLGNHVILSHGGGLYTVYFHCSSVLVSSGRKVSRGSTIARVGSTGISTGNHLHFGVQLNGKYVNPMNYL